MSPFSFLNIDHWCLLFLLHQSAGSFINFIDRSGGSVELVTSPGHLQDSFYLISDLKRAFTFLFIAARMTFLVKWRLTHNVDTEMV